VTCPAQYRRARRIQQAVRPGMKVMFMSGHTQDVLLKEGVERGTAFLQKPFTPAGLAQKVRDTLYGDARSAGQS
jgi:CheY-like chemotaxis protein